MKPAHEENSQWDAVIRARQGSLSLNLAELWRYRDLLALLVRRDFVSFYKQTIFGPIWFFLQPVLTTITFMFVFGKLAGFSTGSIPQPLFYMSGVVAWNYFSECLVKTSTVFKDNANVFGKVYFPRLIMPLSIVFSNLMKFGVQVLMFIVLLLYYIIAYDYSLPAGIGLLLLPVFIALLAVFGLGIGMVISAATTKYRDLSFLVAFGVQLLMYMTPVIYPLSQAPDSIRKWLLLNPVTPIIEGLRFSLFGEGMMTASTLLYSAGCSLGALFLGVWIFQRVERSFIDTI